MPLPRSRVLFFEDPETEERMWRNIHTYISSSSFYLSLARRARFRSAEREENTINQKEVEQRDVMLPHSGEIYCFDPKQ
jgi:hypothetical protein